MMSTSSTPPTSPPPAALQQHQQQQQEEVEGENNTADAPSSSTPPPVTAHGTIRFEDLGEPVQRLLRSIKGDVSDEDMALLEYVSVKDMAKIYGEMATDRHAEEIWEELRAALLARKDKLAKREVELLAKQEALEAEQAAEALRMQQQLAEEEQERIAAEEERVRRREERRRRKAEKAAAAAAEEEAEHAEQAAAHAAAEEAAEEAAAAAEEAERQRKAERKRKRREARARELQEEQDALTAERARHEAKKKQKSVNQKKDWDEYVQNHPLEYTQATPSSEMPAVIEQKELQHTLNAPPVASEKLLSRTYTPCCPSCGCRFDHPPREWNCPVCLKRNNKVVKVWQPDTGTSTCMMCKESIGWFSRHHCRNCGRLVCANCSEKRAVIQDLGYDSPVRVCFDCARMRLK